jgi:hypothetical protein
MQAALTGLNLKCFFFFFYMERIATFTLGARTYNLRLGAEKEFAFAIYVNAQTMTATGH